MELKLAIQLLLIPVLSPLCIGIIRKVKAYLQNRQGATIFQPYRDLWKLFHKDEVVSNDASWIFLFTPYLLFAISILLPLGIPFISSGTTISALSDLLVIIYMLALYVFFLSLAGLDTGSPFGGFGASREVTVLALTEGGLLFAFIPLCLISQSTNLTTTYSVLSSLNVAELAPLMIAFGGFFIALLAENSRVPFDNPATHLELTMIHEAMILEYSGKRLALVEWAAFNKLLIFITLGATLFFPLQVDVYTIVGLLTTLGLLMAKIFAMLIAIAVVESSIAKLRFFRLPDLLFSSFILGVIASFVVLL